MALPSAITYKMGIRTTADAESVSIDPKQPFIIGDQVYRHNPNKHQLLAWVMRNKRYRPTTTSKFGHLEKAPLPNWVTFSGTDEVSQGVTGLTFTNGGTRLTTAFRIRSSRTGEIIRLNADMSGNSTAGVTRNFGTSGTPLIKKGDKFLIMPPAHAEGRTMGEGQTAGEVWQYFRTGIVDWPVQMTGTKAAEKFTDGDPFTNALNDAWEASEGQLEAELLFGARVEDNTTYTYPMHTATGLLSWVTTNVYTLPGYLTRMDLWDIISEWGKFNKEGGAIACSSELVQLINTWAFSKVQYNQDLAKDGINIHQIQTPKGLFDLIEIDLFGQDPYLMGTILFLPKVADKQGIDYRPLIGNENRDIAYLPVDRPEVDLKEGTIFGEYGWEYWGEERFAVATGVEF